MGCFQNHDILNTKMSVWHPKCTSEFNRKNYENYEFDILFDVKMRQQLQQYQIGRGEHSLMFDIVSGTIYVCVCTYMLRCAKKETRSHTHIYRHFINQCECERECLR